MKKVYIITNTAKDPSLSVTHNLVSLLKEYEIESVLVPKPLTDDVECILVLGGDGTLLKAATDYADRNIPFLGINLGTLGFMTEVEISQMDSAVRALLDQTYTIEERMMLNGSIQLGSGETFFGHALNDIVLTRKGSLRILAFDIFVNGRFLNSYKADGMIVSTPTGSTGYNMSAGGPIIEPKAKMILLTPICPHTLSARSIVLSADDEIVIRITNGRNGEKQDMEVNFDGSVSRNLTTGDEIKITKSEKVTQFIRLSHVSFLEILNKKFND